MAMHDARGVVGRARYGPRFFFPTVYRRNLIFSGHKVNFMSEKFLYNVITAKCLGNNTYHTLHINQRDGFTQHHFVERANKKGCKKHTCLIDNTVATRKN